MELILSYWPAFFWLSIGRIVAVGFLTAISNLPYFKSRRIYTHQEIQPAQSKREWLGIVFVPSDAIVLIALMAFGLIRFTPNPDWTVHLQTALVMILWVDLWMYFAHRMMHQSPRLWRMHRHHHLSKITQPVSSISFSFSEKFFVYSCAWLVGMAAISWVMPISFAGIVGYFSVYYFLSAGAHGNTAYYNDRIEFLQSPAIHGLHHVKPNVNYGFWTTLYDRLFDTYKSPRETQAFSTTNRPSAST